MKIIEASAGAATNFRKIDGDAGHLQIGLTSTVGGTQLRLECGDIDVNHSLVIHFRVVDHISKSLTLKTFWHYAHGLVVGIVG